MRSRLAAVVGAVTLGGCSLVGVRTEEQPAYEVVDRLGGGDAEVRRYGPRLAAEVEVATSGGVRKAQGDAFTILAGFIFGGNKGGRKLAMTAPVEIEGGLARIAMTVPVETTGSGGGLTMRFFMPASFTRATLPEPNDPRVRIVDVPGQTVAALRFAGRGTDGEVAARQEALLGSLEGSAWKATGRPSAFFYDPPWTISFLRRNEAVVAVTRP